MSEDPIVKNTTHVLVEANRWGDCGKACSLLFNKDTGEFKEFDFELSLEPEAISERVIDFQADDKNMPWK